MPSVDSLPPPLNRGDSIRSIEPCYRRVTTTAASYPVRIMSSHTGREQRRQLCCLFNKAAELHPARKRTGTSATYSAINATALLPISSSPWRPLVMAADNEAAGVVVPPAGRCQTPAVSFSAQQEHVTATKPAAPMAKDLHCGMTCV